MRSPFDRKSRGRALCLASILVALLWMRDATAQTTVKPRVMVLVDTSGSMVAHMNDNLTCGGDGDALSRFTDVTQTNKSFYPGYPLGGGTYDGSNSRLYAAKQALSSMIQATGSVDFGLMRFHPHSSCPDSLNCCSVARGACFCNPNYVDNPGGNQCTLQGGSATDGLMTWAGGCGPMSGTTATDGGQILVSPSTTSASSVLQWVDGVEDFRSGSTFGLMNPELRASGSTPLAGSMRTALNAWYAPIYTYTKANPACSTSSDPRCDPQIDCRAYALIVMTDGGDTCDGDATNAPPTAVRALHDVNPQNPVLTHVVGLGITSADPARSVLNNMAASGGTMSARFASSASEVQAALAEVVASSVKYEVCNSRDDTCDGLVDEGLGVYQECTQGSQCASGSCNAGRCTCASTAQCVSGNSCSGGFCVPSCSVGIGVCQRTGVRRCNGSGQPACCVADGSPTCSPLQPGQGSVEVCNGIDDDCDGLVDEDGVCQTCNPTAEVCDGIDNDCDGIVDDHLVDVGRACGSSVGACKPGIAACVNGAGQDVTVPGNAPGAEDHLVCTGGVSPVTESCNGVDDDCDGIVDRFSVACYSGPAGTADSGICHGGLAQCAAGSLGACVGEVLPGAEACNGLDDDCNGTVDDVEGAGMPCCPWGSCGVGQCAAGELACSGNALACVGGVRPGSEVCDGVDNDCDGMVDDVPGVGQPCQPASGSCPGVTACDVATGQVACVPQLPSPEICDGIDNDCDGTIDELPMPDDERIGVPCGDATLPAPCHQGTTTCRDGVVACEGAVLPAAEVCNGRDDDCDGSVDVGATCPTGYDCVQGGCFAPCGASGGCPAGYACDSSQHCLAGDDPCLALACGAGQRCDREQRTCVTLAESAGGCGCGTGGPGWMLLVLAAAPLLRSRRTRARTIPLLALALAASLSACASSEPSPEPANPTACDPAHLADDPYNCGACEHQCRLDNATAACAAGECAIGSCQPGFVDLDGSPSNGCEYGCWPASPPVEVCNGLDDDCNGKIDEGFDLQNDPLHCGACDVACVSANGTPACVQGHCTSGVCDAGYVDLNGVAADGCEYRCPLYPPSAETCNGVDDDCDGIVDDDPGDVGQACSDACPAPTPCVSAGTCTFPSSACSGGCCGACTPGTIVCDGGRRVCSPGAGPSAETCNGVDDDCDGQIDQAFDLDSDPLNCGSCGHTCSFPNAYAACVARTCVVAGCKPGFVDLNGGADGCEYACPVWPPAAETCNGKDDDCDGIVDEDLTPPPNFCVQTGPCAGATPVCRATQGWVCNYQAVNPNIEVDASGALRAAETLCDGIDGNCNGQVDESFPDKGKPCSAGAGACRGAGTFQCATNKLSTTCSAAPIPTNARDEQCNGIDDDCDGQIDERTPVAGTICYDSGGGNPHACIGYVDPMVKVGSTWVGAYEASRPDATATSTGTGTSRACAKVGVMPWTNVTEQEAASACAAITVSNGIAMRLCTAAEWTGGCNVGISTGQVWSYASNPTVYSATTCNGVDRGLGAPWATGTGASCYANWAGGKLFDMSGNVAEWTSTQVTVNGVTYYKVRGGEYDSFALGTNCNLDFTVEQTGFRSGGIGFRCCSDAAP